MPKRHKNAVSKPRKCTDSALEKTTNLDPDSVEAILDEIISIPEERVKVLSVFQRFHSGPLPDPETLTAYNSIIPNGADRIMQMAEKQLEHRIDLENIVASSRESQSKRGQVFALIIAITFAGAGVFSIIKGYQIPATIAWGTTLVTIVSTFIHGKKHQR